MIDKLTSQDFSAYLNHSFRIQNGPAQPLDLELIQVTDLGSESNSAQAAARQPFSLVFRGPTSDSYLPQRIYTLEHERMGRLDIFLVPIGPDKQGMRYEAIFN